MEYDKKYLDDKKKKPENRVKNKRARYNLILADAYRAPNYDIGCGTIYPFSELPLMSHIRENIPLYIGDKGEKLIAEANFYPDVTPYFKGKSNLANKSYIGFHVDSERPNSVVFGVRLGTPMPMYFAWFKHNKKISEIYTVEMGTGDIYIMSKDIVCMSMQSTGSSLRIKHAAGVYEKIVKKEKTRPTAKEA